LGKIRPCDTHKLANLLKLRKACGLDGIPNACSKKGTGTSDIYLITAFSYTIFQSLGK
jgi:hypothetical protein